jgi:hypothetical protein
MVLIDQGALKMALNVLRRAGKNEVADELEKTAATGPPYEPTDEMVKAEWDVEELVTPTRMWKAMYAEWESNMGKRPNDKAKGAA